MLCDGSVAVNMRVLMQRHTPDSGTAASLMQSFDAGVLRPRGSLLNRSRCPQSASGDVQEHLRREESAPNSWIAASLVWHFSPRVSLKSWIIASFCSTRYWYGLMAAPNTTVTTHHAQDIINTARARKRSSKYLYLRRNRRGNFW